MKSALEKALERAEQLEPPSEEQMLEWKLAPEGRRWAAAVLNGEGSASAKILETPEEHRAYLLRSLVQVLVSNLQLPRNQMAQDTNELATGELERLLGDKPQAKELIDRIKYVFDQYHQFGLPQREQAYQQLKLQAQQQVEESVRRQTGTTGPGQVNVESLPEFQQQWLQVSGQMDQQYQQHTEETKEHLLKLV